MSNCQQSCLNHLILDSTASSSQHHLSFLCLLQHIITSCTVTHVYVMLTVYYSVPADRMRTIRECILGTYDSTWDKEVIHNLTCAIASISAYGVINSCNIYDMLYHVKSHY